jgi:hypothetical protein
MHGEEGDQGTASFHSTELDGPILVGGVASWATPELFGPRNEGQTGIPAHDTVARSKLGMHNHVLLGMN